MATRTLIGLVVLSISGSRLCTGSVTITNTLADWQALAGPNVTFIGFGEAPPPYPQTLTTQYASVGLTDPEPNDTMLGWVSDWSVDHVVLLGAPLMGVHVPSTITLAFSSPIHAVAVSYGPSTQFVDLLLGDTVVAADVALPTFSSGVGGLYSTLAFDRYVLKPNNQLNGAAFIDDLWFESVPSPGVLYLLGVAIMAARRRRN